jgi:hypothetical protein
MSERRKKNTEYRKQAKKRAAMESEVIDTCSKLDFFLKLNKQL